MSKASATTIETKGSHAAYSLDEAGNHSSQRRHPRGICSLGLCVDLLAIAALVHDEGLVRQHALAFGTEPAVSDAEGLSAPGPGFDQR